MNERTREQVRNAKEKIVIFAPIALAFGVGIVVGRKVQYRATLKQMKQTTTFIKAATPMFPETMPISEIKEIVKGIPDATFLDAVVVNIGNTQRIIIRDIIQ